MFYSLQVQLKKGETDLDFKNYGLEIKVKFHDKDKLQALSSSIQSGGEKSVTTALYMMALQDMTQVHKRDITERSSGSLLLNSGFKLFVQFFSFFFSLNYLVRNFFYPWKCETQSSKVAHNS